MAIKDEIKAVEDKLTADITEAGIASLSFWGKAKNVWYAWLALGALVGLIVGHKL